MIEQLYEAIKRMPGVEALALAGSRASGNNDEKSDYDIYIYSAEFIPNEVRKEYIEPLCSYAEIGNHYFESEDNVILSDGTLVDIIYRNINYFNDKITRQLDECIAMNGYSTCFWHNIKTSEVIFDKTGTLTRLVESASREYPKALKNAIIKRNMELLHGYLPSYDKQIAKAFNRGDMVSVNHRTAAFLESYFDVIFALNEMTHPGEKKLVEICKRDCRILPESFESNLAALFENMFKRDVSDILENIVTELSKVVNANT